MRTLAGRTVLVTGASSGTGRELARQLHEASARVLVAGRDPERTRRVAAEVGSPALLVDFLSLESVSEFATTVLGSVDRLDDVFSNAGGAIASIEPTVDGNEANLQVNALAPLLVETLLQPALLASREARIIATSSGSHRGAALTLERLSAQLDDPSGSAHNRYARAKLVGLIVHAHRRSERAPVDVIDVHPGIVASDFGRYLGPAGAVLKHLARPVLTSPSAAARDIVSIARRESAEDAYFHRRRPRDPSALIDDVELRAAVSAEVAARLRPFLGPH